MSEHIFKIGMYLPELGMPFDASLAKAKEIGVDRVWFNTLGADGPSIRELDDAEVDRMAEQVASHGLEIFLINVGNPFKQIHLTDLDLDGMENDPAFRQDMDDLVRSMQIAARAGHRCGQCLHLCLAGRVHGRQADMADALVGRAGAISPTPKWRSWCGHFRSPSYKPKSMASILRSR